MANLTLNIELQKEPSFCDQFDLRVHGSHVEIRANSALSGKFAKSLFHHAMRAKRLGDVVGQISSRYEKRLLWQKGGNWYRLTTGCKLYLPAWFVDSDELFQDRVATCVALGVNILVFANRMSSASEPLFLQDALFRQRCEEIRLHGLKLALQSDEDVGADYRVFYQSKDEKAVDTTAFEQAARQIQELQVRSCRPILYYMQEGFENLCELACEMKHGSLIGFDAYVNDELHPIYKTLSRLSVRTRLPFVAFICPAEVRLDGKKRFVDLSFDTSERLFGRKAALLGAGMMMSELDVLSDLSMAPFWIIGQRLWQEQNALELFESWLEGHHPDWTELFKKRGLCHLLSELCYLCRTYQVDQAVEQLSRLGDILAAFKEERRYLETSSSVVVLSQLFVAIQAGFKRELESHCTKNLFKIPLALQNFQPIHF